MAKLAEAEVGLTAELLKRPCPVCGNLYRERCKQCCATSEFAVVRCGDCGVTFINEVVNDNFGFSIGPEERPDPVLVLKAAADFKRLEAKLDTGITTHPRCSLLDVGCGTGSFLIEAEKQGWHVAGLELSPSLAAYAREHYGFQVQEASIETLTNFPSESFDVITLFGVIEHLAHPRRAVEECARLLRTDGMLVLQTPSEDGLIRRAGHFLYWATAGGVSFQVAQLYQMGGGHSVCFSRRSMKSLLEMGGFTVVSDEQSTYGFRVLLHRFKNMKFAKRMVQTIGTLIIFSLGQLGGGSNHMTVYAKKQARVPAVS